MEWNNLMSYGGGTPIDEITSELVLPSKFGWGGD